jgi:release factor glutamine methyltransferase
MLYEPHEDSEQLAKEVKKYAYGKVLDVGTGTGFQAKAAASSKKVSEVLAVDIDKDAISYCKKESKHEKISYKYSDLFSKVTGKFDTITFNPPYLPQDEGIEDIALYGGKKGWEVVKRFIEDATDYLEDDGVILLLFSSLTRKDMVYQFLDKEIFKYERLSTTSHFFEKLYVYKIHKRKIRVNIEKSGVTNLQYFNKGKRGLIYSGDYKKKKIVVKFKNPKSTAAGRIHIEGDFLEKLNKVGIGPKLYVKDSDFLVMELIDGISYKEYMENNSKDKIHKIAILLEKQLVKMDELQIDKQEMARPLTNVIIRNEKPILIDFERCRFSQNPKNIRQFREFKRKNGFL